MAATRPTFLSRAFGWLWALSLRVQSASWRTAIEGEAVLIELSAHGRPVILAFWHGKYIPLIALMRRWRGCVFISRSPHGEIIGEIGRRYGLTPIQIPDHGGDHSLKVMKEALAGGAWGAIAVDGPMGPYHAVKDGAIRLASELDHLIVPVTVAVKNKMVLGMRWDRLEFPMPFTKVSLAVGEPISVPSRLSADGLSEWTMRLHDALEDLDLRAEAGLESR